MGRLPTGRTAFRTPIPSHIHYQQLEYFYEYVLKLIHLISNFLPLNLINGFLIDEQYILELGT